MISIITVNRNCKDFLELLVKSVRKFTTLPHEIVVVDNASEDGSQDWIKKQPDIVGIFQPANIGHGRGVDKGIQSARYPFVLILDVDAHLMRDNWDFDLIGYMKTNPDIRLMAAKGGEKKPIHPCFMFLQRRFFLKNNLSFIPTKEYDVGRKLLPDIEGLGFRVFRIPTGYESNGEKHYPGVFGDVYYLNQKPIVYHNWYGSRLYKKTQVDSIKKEDHDKQKAILFSQPLVREILGEPSCDTGNNVSA